MKHYDKCKLIIGGPNRSGTSLLRSMVGSHSQVSTPHLETKLHYHIRNQAIKNSSDVDYGVILKTILELPKIKSLDLDSNLVQNKFTLYGNNEQSIYFAILENLAEKNNKPFYAEKTTYNEHYFETYYRWFGDSLRFVYIIRDPLNTFASLINYRGIPRAVDPVSWSEEWNNSVTKALKIKKVHPKQVMLIKYEDLVKKPIDLATSLCDFMGLKLDVDKMISLHDFPHHDNTSFSKVNPDREMNPIKDKSQLSRYDYIPKLSREFLTSVTYNHAKNFGYDIGEPTLLGKLFSLRGLRHIVRLEGLKHAQT